MRIEIRGGKAALEGYVNAAGRDSEPLVCVRGKCVERIEPGAFARALESAANVDLYLNHDKGRKLGATSDKTLDLAEDNIGLRARCEITDADAVKKARAGEFRGWSFGMVVKADEMEERAGKIPRRTVTELELLEVSVIDGGMTPSYQGTTIESRAGGERALEYRSFDSGGAAVEQEADYGDFEDRIKKLKGARGI
jgi:HK97 family phage prohead protease